MKSFALNKSFALTESNDSSSSDRGSLNNTVINNSSSSSTRLMLYKRFKLTPEEVTAATKQVVGVCDNGSESFEVPIYNKSCL